VVTEKKMSFLQKLKIRMMHALNVFVCFLRSFRFKAKRPPTEGKRLQVFKPVKPMANTTNTNEKTNEKITTDKTRENNYEDESEWFQVEIGVKAN
jgi:hypothetical protein